MRVEITSRRWMASVMAGVVGLSGAPTALATSGNSTVQAVAQPPSSSRGDPPARVGRLSAIEGAVSFRPGNDTVWAPAEPNRVITTGDRLWADANGRAEIEMGTAVIRIGSQTEVDFLHLDDHAIQVRIPQGALNFRVHTVEGGENDEVDAPNAAVAFGTSGSYRVDVSPDGATTTVIVRSGSAEVTAAGSSFPVQAGQAATVQGDSAPTYQVVSAPEADGLDQWAADRDAKYDRAIASVKYVPRDMPGAADVYEQGRWDTDADYGPVWYPPVVIAGWAPYHFGHWAWIDPWGWTWVDDAPWGFAPFHYGRWAFIHGGWGWCPGRVIVRPIFAPALVAFVGGDGWGVSVGFGPEGGIGWFPLAPEEVYYPGYPASITYVRQVNITNVTNITNITNVTNVTNINYRNRTVPGAVVAVPRREFVAGSPVERAAVRVPPTEVTKAPVLGTAPKLPPTRTSTIGAAVANKPAPKPPAILASRPVLANHAPHPAALATGPLPVRSARAFTPGGKTLTPGSPPVVAAGPAHPPTNATPPRPPATGVHVATPVVPQPPAHRATGFITAVPHPPSNVKPAPPLAQQYHAQLSTMEARHVQEYATPPKGETVQRLSARQETEHADLQQRYTHAQVTGGTTLPPPPRAPSPPPAPRPRSSPQPRH
jgi:hypothetical protein